MNEAKARLVRWLADNPDSWLTQSYLSIAKESGVSATSVDRYLPELIADRDEIMPSEVLRRREEAGLSRPGVVKVDRDKIRQAIKENPDTHIRDIAYLVKCHPRIVKKVREEMEKELEESQSAGNASEINDTATEIAELQARLDALLKS